VVSAELPKTEAAAPPPQAVREEEASVSGFGEASGSGSNGQRKSVRLVLQGRKYMEVVCAIGGGAGKLQDLRGQGEWLETVSIWW
jgi:hypothetical protein